MHIRSTHLIAAAFCLILAAPSGAMERFSLNSIRQTGDAPPRVRVYLDATDGAGQPLQDLSRDNVAATLGQERAEVTSVVPFEGSGEGVAHIFLVDVSRSLTEAQFNGIREALESWIGDFGPADQGAIVAFGDESRLVTDFTSDPAALKEGLGELSPSANSTLFHQALMDALDLSRRQDPGIPGRRVIVVLTDGLDEGSGVALQDVLARLGRDPVPVHTIGYSRLRPPERRQQYLDVLKRLSGNSGGTFFEAGTADFAESYAAIRQAIRRVWVVDVACPDCRADGQRHRLQLTVNSGGRVLSEGADVRLLPDPTAPPLEPAGAEGAAAGEAGDAGEAPQEPAAEPAGESAEGTQDKRWWQAVPWWVYLLAGLCLLLFLGLALSSGRRGDDGGEAGAGEEATEEEGGDDEAAAEAPRPPVIPTEPEAPPPPRPRPVRLIVVRGSRKGKEYWVTLRERAVVGARSTCDCVLAEEPGMAAEQFELTQDDGQVFLRNLAPTNPTRMGGHAVTSARRLKSGDLVGTNETILRIILES